MATPENDISANDMAPPENDAGAQEVVAPQSDQSTVTQRDDSRGIVYILTNAAMTGYIKIGKTKGTSSRDVQDRMRELYSSPSSSGVPRPFDCYYAAVVADRHTVEKKLHTIFSDYRINPKREFFERVPLASARAALELVAEVDVTPREMSEGEEEGDIKPPKLPHFKFQKYGIPKGATLVFVRDNTVTCTVEDSNRNVKDSEGEVTTLSPLTQKLLGWRRAPSGADYWLYGDETLADLRRRLDEEDANRE